MGKFTLNDGREIFVDDSSFMSFYQQQIQQQQNQQQVQQSQEAPLPTALSPQPRYNTPAQNIQDALYPQQESLPPGWRRSGTDFAPVYTYGTGVADRWTGQVIEKPTASYTNGGLVIAGGRPSTGIPNFQEARQQATQQEPLKIIGYDTLHDSLGRLVSMPVYERPTVDRNGNPAPPVAQPSVTTASVQPSVTTTQSSTASVQSSSGALSVNDFTEEKWRRLQKLGLGVDSRGRIYNRSAAENAANAANAAKVTEVTDGTNATNAVEVEDTLPQTPEAPAPAPAQTPAQTPRRNTPRYRIGLTPKMTGRNFEEYSRNVENMIDALSKNPIYDVDKYKVNPTDYNLVNRGVNSSIIYPFNQLKYQDFVNRWPNMSYNEKIDYIQRVIAAKVISAAEGGVRMK